MHASLVRLVLISTVACSLFFTACCCLTPLIYNVELPQRAGTQSYRVQENSTPGERTLLHRNNESLPRKAHQDVFLSCRSIHE